jgi:prevent-host-death family protein
VGYDRTAEVIDSRPAYDFKSGTEMSISLQEDFRSLAEFENDPREIVKQVHRTGRPVVVTVKGKPDVIVLDAADFERRLKLVNLARLLAEAEADVRAGRTRPAEEFFSELGREKEVPR